MNIDYVYWRKPDGIDGIAPMSNTLMVDLNLMAWFDALEYFFCFNVEYDDEIHKAHGMATWALFIAREYLEISTSSRRAARPQKKVEFDGRKDIRPFKEYIDSVRNAAEKQYLSFLYKKCEKNISEMARVAKIDRKSIYKKLNNLDIYPNTSWFTNDKEKRRYCGQKKK